MDVIAEGEPVGLQTLRLLALAAGAALTLGCASTTEDDVEAGARATCESQHTPPEQMQTCIDQTAETIREARRYRAERPTRPPP